VGDGVPVAGGAVDPDAVAGCEATDDEPVGTGGNVTSLGLAVQAATKPHAIASTAAMVERLGAIVVPAFVNECRSVSSADGGRR
jgi:hypothetical protein